VHSVNEIELKRSLFPAQGFGLAVQAVTELKGMGMAATLKHIEQLKEELRGQLSDEVWQELVKGGAIVDVPSAPLLTIPERKVLC
jgi:fatty acid-binding protein DegV